MITNELWLNKFGRLRKKHQQQGGDMKKATKEIVTFLAFATTISIVYLGVLLGLVYTAVKVAKHAWQ